MTMIDPGHGGRDPGAVGPTGLQEKSVTLPVSKQVVQLLKDSGIVTNLTRDTDKHFGITISADLSARAIKANQSKSKVFISIHCNSFHDQNANGTETFHHPRDLEGQKLATHIQTRLIPAIKLRDRGVKSENLAVLRETSMPAALVELAFISNPQEEILLKSPDFQKKAAKAIAQGIADYLGVELHDNKIFNDVIQNGSEAATAIEWCKQQGLMKGDEQGNFNPKSPLTREQYAIVEYRKAMKEVK